ncbi:hypothetical protein ScalyP_jg2635 [Parmales sp. scaly parma]|nr:hypothetical protein ScalyP_jg2635 [Parmales sp. scaly parma]
MGMSSFLDTVRRAYMYFERDKEIDELERSSFIDSIPSTPASSTEEKSLINRSLQYADVLNLGGGAFYERNGQVVDAELRAEFVKNVPRTKCDLTYVLHADAKGNLPAKVIDSQIPKGLRSVFQLRETFNRDDEIDQEERNELMGVMKNDENEVYGEEENEMVKRITKKMKSVKEDLFTPLNSPDFRTKMSIAHIEGDSNAYMKCVSVTATKIMQVSETECKIEMIFDPIPKKRKHRERSFSKPNFLNVAATQEAAHADDWEGA